MNWAYFVYGMIFWQLVKILYQALDQELRERRERKFLKAVHVEFPENVRITFVAVSTSDRKALKDVETQMYERFDFEEGQEGIMRESSEPWPD